MLTAAQVLRLVATASFRQMDSYDRQVFEGVNSINPLIHYSDQLEEHYTIILDGDRICLVDDEGVEKQFHLGENVFA